MGASPQPQLAVVIGLHRSGTSVTARSLRCFGFELGDDLMGALPNNPKGFFEDMSLYRLNVRILRHLGRSWFDSRPLTGQEVQKLLADPLADEARALVRKKSGEHALLALKDPRIALLGQFWTTVLRQQGLKTSYVICVRNPLSVARSLEQRDQLPPTQGVLIWLSQMVQGWYATRSERQILVDFDAMMADPGSTLRGLSTQLDLPVLAEQETEFLQTFLDRELYHHEPSASVSDDEVSADDPRPVALALYQTLAECCARSAQSPSIAPLMENASALLAQQAPALRALDESAAAHFQQRLATKKSEQLALDLETRHAAQLDQARRARETALAEQSRVAAEHRQQAEQANKRLAACQAEAERLSNRLLKLESDHGELGQVLEESRHSISRLQRDTCLAMAQAMQEASRIWSREQQRLRSWRWRLTAPLGGPAGSPSADQMPSWEAIAESSLFDERWYQQTHGVPPDQPISAAQHYALLGWRLGYDPGPQFSTSGYLADHSDVADEGINPLWHYLLFGRHEERAIRAPD